MSEAVSDSRTVAAPPAVVLDVITDIEAYEKWQDDVRSVDVLERDGQGRPARARFVVDARIFTADYTLAYTYGEGSVRWELVASDQLRQLDGGYTVADTGDGASRVDYELVVEPAISVPRFLRRSAAQRIVRTALDELKQRAESMV